MTAASSSHTTEAIKLSAGLRFPCQKSFDGSEKGFDDFAYRLRAYPTMANPLFKGLMKQVQETTNTGDWERLDDHQKMMVAQLQNVLTALCEGPATKIVQRYEDSDNGFEIWHRLWFRYKPLKRTNATSIMTTILE